MYAWHFYQEKMHTELHRGLHYCFKCILLSFYYKNKKNTYIFITDAQIVLCSVINLSFKHWDEH